MTMTDAQESSEGGNVENWELQRIRDILAKPPLHESASHRELLTLYAELLEKEGPGPFRKLFVRLVSRPVGRFASRDWSHDIQLSWNKQELEEEEDDFVDKWEVCVKAGSSHVYIIFHFHDNYADVTGYALTNQQSAEAFFKLLVEQQEAWLEKDLRGWSTWGLMQARSSEGCGRRTSTLYEREEDDDADGAWAYPDKGDRYVMQCCELPDEPK